MSNNKWKMGQIFVAFSDYLNFKKCPYFLTAVGKVQCKDFHTETQRCVLQTNFSFLSSYRFTRYSDLIYQKAGVIVEMEDVNVTDRMVGFYCYFFALSSHGQ